MGRLKKQKGGGSDSIPISLITLGLSEEVCFSEIYSIPLEMTEAIVSGSVFIPFQDAIAGNLSLIQSGHCPEVRALVDKYLNQEDFEALKVLAVAHRVFLD